MHSSILALRIQWTEEPGRLQYVGPRRVEHKLATKQQPPSSEESTDLLRSCSFKKKKKILLLVAELGS